MLGGCDSDQHRRQKSRSSSHSVWAVSIFASFSINVWESFGTRTWKSYLWLWSILFCFSFSIHCNNKIDHWSRNSHMTLDHTPTPSSSPVRSQPSIGPSLWQNWPSGEGTQSCPHPWSTPPSRHGSTAPETLSPGARRHGTCPKAEFHSPAISNEWAWSRSGSGCGLNQEVGMLFKSPVIVILVQFPTTKKW